MVCAPLESPCMHAKDVHDPAEVCAPQTLTYGTPVGLDGTCYRTRGTHTFFLGVEQNNHPGPMSVKQFPSFSNKTLGLKAF